MCCYQEWGADLGAVGSHEQWKVRQVCIEHGMYAIVTKDWTQRLAAWIGDRTVLEVMAGRGWLAKALIDHGVSISVTDNNSWGGHHSRCGNLVAIDRINAEVACAGSKEDILLMSWPPYSDPGGFKAIRAWGTERPIVFIGEYAGGCCADAKFFQHFRVDDANTPAIRLPKWLGLHDELVVGHYVEKAHNDDT